MLTQIILNSSKPSKQIPPGKVHTKKSGVKRFIKKLFKRSICLASKDGKEEVFKKVIIIIDPKDLNSDVSLVRESSSEKIQEKSEKTQEKLEVQEKSEKIQEKSEKTQEKSEKTQEKSEKSQEESEKTQEEPEKTQEKSEKTQEKSEKTQEKSSEKESKYQVSMERTQLFLEKSSERESNYQVSMERTQFVYEKTHLIFEKTYENKDSEKKHERHNKRETHNFRRRPSLNRRRASITRFDSPRTRHPMTRPPKHPARYLAKLPVMNEPLNIATNSSKTGERPVSFSCPLKFLKFKVYFNFENPDYCIDVKVPCGVTLDSFKHYVAQNYGHELNEKCKVLYHPHQFDPKRDLVDVLSEKNFKSSNKKNSIVGTDLGGNIVLSGGKIKGDGVKYKYSKENIHFVDSELEWQVLSSAFCVDEDVYVSIYYGDI
ncbi:15300_t:CDS:1 [Acaulospora morrowiae]|uniref:15300_t:CDS:1 n=1 Tax=Acaulospora morrowiae TaxID=94023 RepID=A0A9N9I4K0_9GLOM|nr:15300_t:CDS:1 [Acaulospora morrowiae]